LAFGDEGNELIQQ
jgi:hypothetical protein